MSKTIEEARAAGYQAGRHGPDTTNSHFTWFFTTEMTRAWEEGHAQGCAEAKQDAAVKARAKRGTRK